MKQRTAYERRISDWSSDVCSSDLAIPDARADRGYPDRPAGAARDQLGVGLDNPDDADTHGSQAGKGDVERFGHKALFRVRALGQDRKTVVWGKGVSVCLVPRCRCIMNRKDQCLYREGNKVN